MHSEAALGIPTQIQLVLVGSASYFSPKTFPSFGRDIGGTIGVGSVCTQADARDMQSSIEQLLWAGCSAKVS